MRTILISGVSIRSRGGVAMVKKTIELFPEFNYKIISFYPEEDKKITKNLNQKNLKIIPIPLNKYKQISFKLEILFRIFDYLSLYLFPRKKYFFSSYSRILSKCIAVFEIHGISFSDQYGLPDAINSFLQVNIAKKLKKKYLALPQSYGPISSNLLRKIAKTTLNKFDLLTPRGYKSIKLIKSLNVKTKSIFIPDLAFDYINPNEEDIKKITNKFKLNLSKPAVAIIPNSLFIKWNADYVIDYYAEIINNLKNKFTFWLIPHEYADKGIDDRTFLRKLIKKIDSSSYIFFKQELSAIEIKALLSFCSFSICSRFHGMISSLKMNTTPFVIGWADKYLEIMKLFELSENVTDYKSKKMPEFIKKIVFEISNNNVKDLKEKNISLAKEINKLKIIIGDIL